MLSKVSILVLLFSTTCFSFSNGSTLKYTLFYLSVEQDTTQQNRNDIEVTYITAHNKAKNTNNLERIIASSIQLAEYYGFNITKESKALEIYNDLYTNCSKYNDTTCFIRHHLSLAQFYLRKFQYSKALDLLNKSLEYAEATNDKNVIWQILNSKGTLFNSIGEWDKGRIEFKKSANYLTDFDYEDRYVTTYLNISSTYKNPDSIIYYSNIITKHCKTQKTNDGCVSIYNNIAFAYTQKGMPKKALEVILNNLDIDHIEYNTISNSYTAIMHTLGLIYFQLQQYDLSIHHFKKSLYYSELEGYLPDIIETKEDMALSYEKNGDITTALKLLKEVKPLSVKFNEIKIKKEITNIESRRLLEEKEKEIINLEQENQEFQFAISKAKILTYSLLSVLLIVLAVIYYYRQKNKIKLYKLNEELSINRLKSLRSVMNPHFLFNSFSTLQNYILKKENLKANDYMTDISSLIREVMANSDTIYTLFNDEIALIKTYLKVEQGRFDPGFKVEYTIDSELTTSNPTIPSMIIQPHIENAIVHGISSCLENAVIKIAFKKKGNNVICTIEDNGIGRKKASDLKNKENTPPHLSIATKNIQERLKILSKIGFKHTSIKIYDLYNNDGKPNGTKVIITLPTQKALN